MTFPARKDAIVAPTAYDDGVKAGGGNVNRVRAVTELERLAPA